MGNTDSAPDLRTEDQKRLDANKIPRFLGPYFENRKHFTGTYLIPPEKLGNWGLRPIMYDAGGFSQITDLDTLWVNYRDKTNTNTDNYKLFAFVVNYLDELGQQYKQGIEKYIKQMEYETNQQMTNNLILDADGQVQYNTDGTPKMNTFKPIHPEYLNIKKTIPNIYDLFKGALGDSRSILIPSILWVNYGVPLSYQKDTPNPIPNGGVDIVLTLQQLFENKVFLLDKASYWEVARLRSDVLSLQLQNENTLSTNDDKLKVEYERQKSVKASFHILRDDKKGYTTYQTINMTYDAWKPLFIKSVEFKDFIKKTDTDIKNTYIDTINTYYAKTGHAPASLDYDIHQVDVQKLAETKDFYAGDVFEDEDVDSVNYDVIRRLKDQETMYNQTLQALRAQYKQSEDDLKKKLDDAFEVFKQKVEDAKVQNFKEIDDAIKTNQENVKKRQQQQEQRKMDAATDIQESSALAQLSNYQGCNSIQKPQRTYEVIKDVDIQDLLNKQGQQLYAGSGRSKLSLSQQIQLINKLYAQYYDEDGPHIISNSARKVGGDVDPQAVTTGLDATSAVIGTLAAAMPPPIDLVCGLISGFLSLFSLFWGKSKAEEEEERRKEEERQQNIFEDWKTDTMETTISVLEAEVDEDKFKTRKEEMIQKMLTDAKYEITQAEIDQLEQSIDDAHEQTMKTRQEVLDTIAQNTKDIVQMNADLIEENQANLSEITAQNNARKKQIIDDYLAEAKARAQDFLNEDQARQLDMEKEKIFNKQVTDKITEKQKMLEDQAQQISQLKGTSECSMNVKSKDEMKKEAIDELKKQQTENDEAIARGEKPPNPPPATVPTQGSGLVRRKKTNKNSIAQQMYLLNKRYIETFD